MRLPGAGSTQAKSRLVCTRQKNVHEQVFSHGARRHTSQPGGLEFEVMDMLYHLPFRDWMELDKGPSRAPVAAADEDQSSGSPGGR